MMYGEQNSSDREGLQDRFLRSVIEGLLLDASFRLFFHCKMTPEGHAGGRKWGLRQVRDELLRLRLIFHSWLVRRMNLSAQE